MSYPHNRTGWWQIKSPGARDCVWGGSMWRMAERLREAASGVGSITQIISA